MSELASQLTSRTIVYTSVYSDADQRKHQGFAPLAFVRGIHRRPVNFPHKGLVTRKMFPFDDVIMYHSRSPIWLPHSRESSHEEHPVELSAQNRTLHFNSPLYKMRYLFIRCCKNQVKCSSRHCVLFFWNEFSIHIIHDMDVSFLYYPFKFWYIHVSNFRLAFNYFPRYNEVWPCVSMCYHWWYQRCAVIMLMKNTKQNKHGQWPFTYIWNYDDIYALRIVILLRLFAHAPFRSLFFATRTFQLVWKRNLDYGNEHSQFHFKYSW